MPFYRKDKKSWYTDRRWRSLGNRRVVKTLATRRKNDAVYRESVLVTLDQSGRSDILEKWEHGVVGADQIAAAVSAGSLDGLLGCSIHVTLEEAVTAMLAHKEPDLAESTYQRYRTCMDHFMKFAGARERVVEALTTEVVQAYKKARLDAGAAKETINNELIAIGVLSSYCTAPERSWIARRPMLKKYRTAVRVRFLTDEQRLEYFRHLDPRYRTLMWTLLNTGMRLGEAMNLKVCDLKFGDRVALVHRKVKGESSKREPFLPTGVIECLQKWIEERGLQAHEYLFKGWPGFSTRSIQKAHNKACEDAGIHEYTIHDHRHSCAVALAREGCPMPLIQQQLGHSTIQQTMRYAAFHPEYSDMAKWFGKVEENGKNEVNEGELHPLEL